MPKKKQTKLKKNNRRRDISIVISIALILLASYLVIELKFFQTNNNQSIGSISNKVALPKTSLQNTASKSAANTSVKTTTQNTNSALASLQNSGPSVHVPILYYHYISENPNPKDTARNSLLVTPTNFDEQMGYLSTHGFTPITLDTLYAGLEGKQPLPPKPIVLTFDDGYIDFYLDAYPILRKYGFHAVSFIPTGLMNQGYYLHWDQIKIMDQSGLISFQAHTVNHVSLPSEPTDKAIYQISEAKKVLEAELGKPVNFMAYPYGTNDGADWQLVKQAGFVGALGTWYGETESVGLIYDWPRIKVGNWTAERFAKAF